MKKLLCLVLSLLMISAVFAGCTDSGKEDPTTSTNGSSSTTDAPDALSGKLVVNGSTSMEKMMNALGEKFMVENKDVSVEVQGSGSSEGITKAAEGTCDIGTSSRALKDEEKTENADLVETTVAYDGIAVVVNSANPVTALTSEQIAKIFTGEITNWSEVGGNDAKIIVVLREAGSGTRDGFESTLDIADKCVGEIEAKETGIVKSNVSSQENAIGYMSLGSVDDTLKALEVDGVAPTNETVVDGTYTISRPFVCVTKGEPDGLAKSFIDYILSDEGQAVVEQTGFVKI